MSATSVIELDTTPPDFVLGDPVRLPGGVVQVPYELADDGLITEVVLSTVEGVLPVQIFSDHFEMQLPIDISQQTAHLSVTAIDEVLNPVIRVVGIDIAGSSAEVSGRVTKNPQVLYEVDKNPRVSGRVTKNPRVESEIHGS